MYAGITLCVPKKGYRDCSNRFQIDNKMAMCEYEVQREARMADNRRRMEEMGLFEVKGPGHHANLS